MGNQSCCVFRLLTSNKPMGRPQTRVPLARRMPLVRHYVDTAERFRAGHTTTAAWEKHSDHVVGVLSVRECRELVARYDAANTRRWSWNAYAIGNLAHLAVHATDTLLRAKCGDLFCRARDDLLKP